MPATSPRTLIYLHVPKCGGSTLNNLLKRNVPGSARYYVTPQDVATSRRELAALPDDEKRQIRLLHGHLSYGWHEHLPQEAVYFTVLRDPVARVVSHYNYVRFRTDHSHYLRDAVQREEMSLADYVTSGVCDEANNGQVRLLSGVEDIVQVPYGPSKVEYGTNDEALLEQALANIDRHFAMIGVQERFDESILLMGSKLGFTHLAYEPTNIGHHHYTKRTPTPDDVALIKRYNQLDLALYQMVRERFEERLKQSGLTSAHVQAFRVRKWMTNKARPLWRRLRNA